MSKKIMNLKKHQKNYKKINQKKKFCFDVGDKNYYPGFRYKNNIDSTEISDEENKPL